MTPEECLDEIIQNVLNYIEKESECWDEEELAENGIIEIIQLIFEASGKQIFIDVYKSIEESLPILRLSEDTLYDQSKFFYRDCLNSFLMQNLHECDEKINFYEFYDIFVHFIQKIRRIEIEEGMQNNLQQLIKLLKKVYFTSGDIIRFPDEIERSSLRYVKDEMYETVYIDVKKQTIRFWTTWILEKIQKNISVAELQLKRMKKQEVLIWLFLVSIYNFAGHFGDEELKELRDCILYPHNINEIDIGSILKWCFGSYVAIKSGNIDRRILNEIGYYQGLQGLFSLMERFHYINITVKKTIKEEMECCWEQKEKMFASQIAYNAWTNIKIWSIDRPRTIANGQKYKDEEEMVSDKISLNKGVKEIWKDIRTGKLIRSHQNNQKSCDSDELEEWEFVIESIWSNRNFEYIKEDYLNKYDNGLMTEEEFASAFKNIWEFAWELFEKIFVCKNTQTDTERISVDELKLSYENLWNFVWGISNLFCKERDIKNREKKNDRKLSDEDFEKILSSELNMYVDLYTEDQNLEINYFTAYIAYILLSKISLFNWEYGLLSVKHIIFAKLYILISELSEEDIKKWIESDFQDADSDIGVIISVIDFLLEEYSWIYKTHTIYRCCWMEVVRRILLNSKKIKVSKRLSSSLLKRKNDLDFKVDKGNYISWDMLPTIDYLFEVFIKNILYEPDYLV